MTWRAVRGDETEPLGWYSPGFDVRLAAFTLEGEGEMSPGEVVTTRLSMGDGDLLRALEPDGPVRRGETSPPRGLVTDWQKRAHRPSAR